jgi:hypothetical protein
MSFVVWVRNDHFGFARTGLSSLGSKSPSQTVYFDHRYLLRAKFTLSVPGMGVDCYRTYEALQAGSIPIVLSGAGLEPMLKDLPVMFVRDYTDLTVEALEAAHVDMMSRAASFDFNRCVYCCLIFLLPHTHTHTHRSLIRNSSTRLCGTAG